MSAYAWAIVTAAIWSVVPILEKIGLASPNFNARAGLFYRCIGVVIGLVLLAAFMVKPQEIKAVDLRSASFLVLAGFLASFVAQMTFYYALKIGDVSRIVPLSASYPLLTFALGVLVLGENVSLLKALGILGIIAGIWALKVG